MRDFLSYISGEVPGGVILLLFLLAVMNLALWYLYNSSKLFSRTEYRRKALKGNVFLLGLYIILWFVLKPPVLPGRILVLPFQKGEKADFVLCEALQRKIAESHGPQYTPHPWEWFYQTADKDSIRIAAYRENLARKLAARIIISGDIEENAQGLTVSMNVNQDGESENFGLQAMSYRQAADELFERLRQSGNYIEKNFKSEADWNDKKMEQISRAKLLLLNGQGKEVLGLFPQPDSSEIELVAAAYLLRGFNIYKEHPGLAIQDDEKSNQGFRHLFNLILPYSKLGKDTAAMNILLARMYMHVKNYEMADICLNKAMTQQKFNARIYFYLSFLHASRYRDKGFENRVEILQHAVALDPGYPAATYELALEMYSSGTAAATHPMTVHSIELLRHFLTLNPENEQILALLGRILLQSKYTLEAADIYKKLIRLTDAAEYHYNMGICYFHMEDYDQAKKQFYRAIKIADYPDAYLYLGAIAKLRGDEEKALYYYRERVTRKQGDDDTYAKQAMRGIRLILNDIAEREEQEMARDSAHTKN